MKILLITILLTAIQHCYSQSFALRDTASMLGVIADSLIHKDAIRLWPNPAVNDVYITIKQPGIIIKTIFIFDKNGNKVMERKINSILASPIKLAIGDLTSGLYFLIADTNKKGVRLQLIKQ